MWPFELSKEMRQWNQKPDLISYRAAISAIEARGEWLLPFELLKDIREWNLAPDVISYSAAIRAREKGAEW